MTVELTDEQWQIVKAELPRGSELRQRVKEAHEDAMLWGQAELELSDDDVQRFYNLGLQWLEDKLDTLQPEPRLN